MTRSSHWRPEPALRSAFVGSALVALVTGLIACGSSHDVGSTARGGANAIGGRGGSSDGSGASAGTRVATGGSTAGGAGGVSASGGASSTSVGGPGCGLASAAFCDTFDRPALAKGRAGELDVNAWSGGRFLPQGPTAFGQAFGITSATLLPSRTTAGTTKTLPACRANAPATVYPDHDTLICDASSDIGSAHLLVAVAAQNYGENSYRVRQPFDFAGRTGTIVFDAEAFESLGWVSLDLTDEPLPVPTYSAGPPPAVNNEGGAIPRNGIELQFSGDHGGVLRHVSKFEDYVESDDMVDDSNLNPVATAWGKLNHFEVAISTTHLSVRVSPPSNDGVTFPAAVPVYDKPIALKFSRAYVHITTHNHATFKYTSGTWSGNSGFTDLDAWIARWDNVGFDGPVISNAREYEVGDSLVPYQWTQNDGSVAHVMNIGWTVPDASANKPLLLHVKGVDPSGAAHAAIALAAAYCQCGQSYAQFDLRYRLNGHVWHDRFFDAGELSYLDGGTSQGGLSQMLDVPVAELVTGDNDLEFEAVNIPQNYPPGIVNVDLIVKTE